ncbi:ankyrin repeat-containing domain protein [Trichoderma ceciliae]
MHQTVREFFLDPNGLIANSEFGMCETHAHARIAITCIRYLQICATNTSLAGRLPKINSWTLAHYQEYVQYLDKRPLAFYALCHVKYHIDGCWQQFDMKHVTSRFVGNLTDNPGSFLIERWASSQPFQVSLSNIQGAIAKGFRDKVLRTAVVGGFTTATEVLLSVGMDLEKKDENGRTPLSWASGNGHQAIVKSLLEKGAVIDAKDINGRTSLSWAAENGHQATVKLLLDKGAIIDAKDYYGRTSLSWAAKNGHQTTVKLLLKKGAHVNVMDIHGLIPLSWAAGNGHEAIVNLLLLQEYQHAERSGHGDFQKYHGRFGHDIDTQCRCGEARKTGHFTDDRTANPFPLNIQVYKDFQKLHVATFPQTQKTRTTHSFVDMKLGDRLPQVIESRRPVAQWFDASSLHVRALLEVHKKANKQTIGISIV